jgi:hypothetical protein
MNAFRPVSLLTLALLAGLAGAATQLETLRAESKAGREKVASIREQRASLRKELNDLASRIEHLKSERSSRLFRNSELQTALRRSQQLSGRLSELARDLSSVEAASQRTDIALLGAISEELTRLGSEWEGMKDTNARRQVVARLRELRVERDRLRSDLPSAPLPPLESVHPSEDPEDLREQADAARDAEDKVRRQLRVVETRIAEAREEKELDRRMNQFLGDEYMFDEHDRRLRFGNSSATFGRTPGATGPTGQPQGDTARPSAPSVAAGQPHPEENAPGVAGLSTRAEALASGNVARQASMLEERKSLGSDLDNIRSLELERQRLQSLAEQLQEQAQQLERRARSLR